MFARNFGATIKYNQRLAKPKDSYGRETGIVNGCEGNRIPPPPSSKLARWVGFLRHGLGFDRAVTFTVLARAWASGSGLVTVVLIARFLSPAEQGYYYTYASLIALQLVFELGFSQVVMQVASHERAHLSIAQDGSVEGDKVAHARLASILQLSVRWYGVGALCFALVLIPAGLYFFSSHQHLGDVVSWRAPWIAVALAAVFAFQLDPLYSFFEGCGFVSNIAHMRWIQAIVGSLLAWILLIAHHGLYAPAMVIAGQVLVGTIWLATRRGLLLDLMTFKTGGPHVSWQNEIWPFQWRMAISWISGYFVYQTFNPFLFAFKGPVAAGQMGMSLSFANSVMAIASAWVSTKAAPFGTLIAQKLYQQLDTVFFQALRQSIFVAGLGAAAVWSVTTYLHSTQGRYAHKVLSPLPLALLLAAAILNHVFASMAIYLRAHKQERLFQISLSIAAAVLLSNYFFAKTSGALGMVGGYLVIMALLGVGCGALIFNKYRKLWHSSQQNA
jgi:O-antigen/teichoic acid export membrane protein